MGIRSALFLIGTLLLAPGCGSSEVRLYPVKGKVSGGQGSLKGVVIVFQPVDPASLGSSGVLGEDGAYTLASGDGRSGATPGKYKVTFALSGDSMQAAMKEMAKNPPKAGPSGGQMPPTPGGASAAGKMPAMNVNLPFPQAYSAASTSPKEVEVKAESNEIDISL